MTASIKVTIFIIVSVIMTIVSRRSLINMQSHGFYRFFVWEFILILFLLNVDYWFVESFSLHQIISWILLVASSLFVVEGYRLLRTKGNTNTLRPEKYLYNMEKTKNLVTEGIYHYIRHPLYASLLFLAWGIFFKSVTSVVFILVIGTSFFLALTAKAEEKENCEYFGDDYKSYMKRTKMFIPYFW